MLFLLVSCLSSPPNPSRVRGDRNANVETFLTDARPSLIFWLRLFFFFSLHDAPFFAGGVCVYRAQCLCQKQSGISTTGPITCSRRTRGFGRCCRCCSITTAISHTHTKVVVLFPSPLGLRLAPTPSAYSAAAAEAAADDDAPLLKRTQLVMARACLLHNTHTSVLAYLDGGKKTSTVIWAGL